MTAVKIYNKFILIFLLLAMNYDQTMTQNVLKRMKTCADRFGLTLPEVINLNTAAKLAENYVYKCYQNCFLELGLVMKNGTFLYEQTRARVEEDNNRIGLLVTIDACRYATDQVDDPCEAAYQLELCFEQAAAESTNKE